MGLGTGVGPTRREDKKHTITPCAKRERDAELLISKGHKDVPSLAPWPQGRPLSVGKGSSSRWESSRSPGHLAHDCGARGTLTEERGEK